MVLTLLLRSVFRGSQFSFVIVAGYNHDVVLTTTFENDKRISKHIYKLGLRFQKIRFREFFCEFVTKNSFQRVNSSHTKVRRVGKLYLSVGG